LCSIHYLLRHTPIHLSLAETRSRQLGHDELAAFFAHKRAEEDGHHRWAEADMSRFAERFNISIPTDPSPTMRALVDANTDTVMDDPFLYLAYILLTEYFVVRTGSEWIAALSENCGIPASMVTAVGNHAELDKDHVEEGCAEIDALVGPERVDSVRRALGGMIDRLRAFSEDLCDDVN
jgi:pyrroloquinoline quinone (PQQ) biosynthesis protein C